jgi:hypothetical protein
MMTVGLAVTVEEMVDAQLWINPIPRRTGNREGSVRVPPLAPN